MGKIGSKLGSLAIIGGLIASLHFLHAQGIESSGGNMTPTLGYPSNSLWLSVASVSNGWLILTLNGTQPGSNYTLLSQATLTASNWSTAGLVTGAQNQSWTTAQLPLTDATLFVWAQYNGGSGGGTNGGGGGTAEDYGTGLWLKTGGVSNGVAGLSVVNSAQDILYEIEDKTNLLQSDWISCGFVYGSELTNWTPISVFAGNSGNLFLRIRSWEDSTGTGIPDWWWLQCFGQTTNVDPNASPAGDGYSNLQKFQMGLNSTNYYNPNTPGGFFGYVDSSGTNVYLMWNPAGGPVVNYAIQRGIYNTNTGNYDYSQFLLNSNATFFEDVGVVTNDNAQNDVYNLEAVYPGGSLSATNTWYPIWYADWGSDGPPYGPPASGNFDAHADATGTNVELSWTPAPGPATNYIIERGIYDTGSATYDYTPIANVNTNATAFEVVSAITNQDNWGDSYGVVAVYPGGGLSGPATSDINIGSTDGPAAPNGFYGYADSTGTNIFLTWNASPGAVNYILYQGVVDYDTYLIVYHQIGNVNADTNSFEVVGAITQPQDLYNYYKIAAVYPGGSLSQSAYWYVPTGAPGPDALAAYLDSTGTNVLLSWTPAQGAMIGYVVERSINPTSATGCGFDLFCGMSV